MIYSIRDEIEQIFMQTFSQEHFVKRGSMLNTCDPNMATIYPDNSMSKSESKNAERESDDAAVDRILGEAE